MKRRLFIKSALAAAVSVASCQSQKPERPDPGPSKHRGIDAIDLGNRPLDLRAMAYKSAQEAYNHKLSEMLESIKAEAESITGVSDLLYGSTAETRKAWGKGLFTAPGWKV